jgi:hypothetical protein
MSAELSLLLNSGDYLGKAHCGLEYLAVVYRPAHNNVPLNNLALALKISSDSSGDSLR